MNKLNILFQRRIKDLAKLGLNRDSLSIMNKFYYSFNDSNINYIEKSNNRDKILNMKFDIQLIVN